MAGDTGKKRRNAGEPHGGELAGGSYQSHPHHEPPEEGKNSISHDLKARKGGMRYEGF